MIVVIGAGLVGLAIARELAARGAEVRVLEAGEPGRGASWAGAGMLAPYTEELAAPAYEALCLDSLARYPAFVAALREATGVDARLRLGGIAEVAFDAAGETRLRARVAALQARGARALWLDAAEVRAREPALAPDVRGGALASDEGSVDNRRLARALAGACAALGVRVETDAGDVAIEATPRRVLGVRTRAGFVPADVVVNAAGARAGALGGVPAHAAVPVMPVKGQMLALAIEPGAVAGTTWVPGAYLVPRDDGRLLVGATVEAADDVRVTAGGMLALLAATVRAMPGLARAALVETWAGLRPGSPDGLPYLGATALGGYVVASGHHRNGILLAPATAVAIADGIEGVPRPDLAPFSPLRAQEPSLAGAKPVA